MNLYSNLDIVNIEDSLTYSDIGLIPTEISEIEHRELINTYLRFLGKDLSLPVLSSPMESVTGILMATELGKQGVFGIINRFDDSLKQLEKIEDQTYVYGISLGVYDPDEIYERWNTSKSSPVICIDTANVQNRFVLNKIEAIKKRCPTIKLIVGNIAYCNFDHKSNILKELDDLGVGAVRIGIGNGSACSTSVKTGVGLGQASSVSSCYLAKLTGKLNIKLIADGGIESVGDICKALALSADVVMLGRIFAGTKESPGNVIKYNDKLFKVYRGSASYGVKHNDKYIEGEESLVPYKGTVLGVLNEIRDGLQSSMSYLNANNLDELKQKALFVRLSHSSYIERLPRI